MSYNAALDKPAQYLKGVGPKRAKLLERLGVGTARDLLYHVPRRYEDASTVRSIATLQPGDEATIVGRVVSKGVLPTRKGLRIFQAVVRDESELIGCAWPGQPYLDRVIQKGDLLLLRGPVRFYHGRQIQPREYEVLSREGDEQDADVEGAVFPIYPATDGLTQRQIRRMIGENLDDLLAGVRSEDLLAPAVTERAGVHGLATALAAVHRPGSMVDAEQGRRRLAFEELFFLQLLHAASRHANTIALPGIAFARPRALVRRLFGSLPYQLTAAQIRVLREIGADMGAERRMNRLLQGDVGSGKTVVALLAMARAVENGYQAALMAPTELLAEQHVRTLESLIGDCPLEVQLLTGRMSAPRTRDALDRVSGGDARIVVGTQALIQERVSFHKLGLVVVDEQHRFGVRQRLALAAMGEAANGERPDVLVMSATPIPRSLALSLYGDLDISVLDERPPGRRPIRTALRSPGSAGKVYQFVREQAAAGRQAYIVYPLVEESDAVDAAAAIEEYDRLSGEVFAGLRVGLMHGQMAGDDKDAAMRAFAAGEIDILVSTTVIEVGIDVPNATVMVIMHGERFGLSQLHQLRGRVGRGANRSFCIVISGQAETVERLGIFASTDDGFTIARADLGLRGQGDLFGDRQSGLPSFRFADLERDVDLLGVARDVARELIEGDPRLDDHSAMREVLETRYGERARLFRTG
jgi:ATP-dependent DNA helicase RecG